VLKSLEHELSFWRSQFRLTQTEESAQQCEKIYNMIQEEKRAVQEQEAKNLDGDKQA